MQGEGNESEPTPNKMSGRKTATNQKGLTTMKKQNLYTINAEEKTIVLTKKFDKSPTTGEYKFHPTQKPVELYAWILKHYANPGDRIFDPMMGSQSSRIAAYKMGFDYVGCELDKEYFDKGCERFNRECKGEIVTKDGNIVKQMSLFDL